MSDRLKSARRASYIQSAEVTEEDLNGNPARRSPGLSPGHSRWRAPSGPRARSASVGPRHGVRPHGEGPGRGRRGRAE
jgi:hypothetical protein